MDISHGPSIVEDGTQDQRVRINCNHKVCDGQADNKDVAYKKKRDHERLAKVQMDNLQLKTPL